MNHQEQRDSNQHRLGDRGHAHLLASGSLAQQASQVTGLIAMFVILTVLAHRLTLSELGVYGLLSSLAGYLIIVQNAAASAAVKNMAAAAGTTESVSAFSTAAVVYVGTGAGTGAFLAVIGFALSGLIDMTDALMIEARRGSVLLGLITLIGWPGTIWRDALRATQRFNTAAVTDIVAVVIFAVVQLGLVLGNAPLWVLIGTSGAIPLFAGFASAVAAHRVSLPFRFDLRGVTWPAARDLLGTAGYISLNELASVVIYALDRTILGIFRSAATVGLFEGPVRVHNLVRTLNGALNVVVLPTASRYVANGDDRRLRELLVRGTRYALALVVPVTVTAMVLAEPILEVWLGPRFRVAGTTLSILVSYWLVTGSLGITGAMIVAAGRARTLARYAWYMAIANLSLSLALTPWLGLEGVALGTTIPYVAMFPFYLRLVLSVIPVPLGRLVRESWIPAYSTGMALAIGLLVCRATLALDTVATVVGVAAVAVLAYWVTYYAIWLRPHERQLVRDVARSVVPTRVA